MKKVLKSLSLLTAAALLMTACSKKYEPTKDESRNPFKGDFTASLWGAEPYVADLKMVVDTTIEGVRSLSIATKQFLSYSDTTQYRLMTISIGNFTGPNTYPIGAFTTFNQVIISYDSANKQTFNQDNNDPEGFIVVTKAENNAYEGTFQFKTINTVDTSTIPVTSGVFNLAW